MVGSFSLEKDLRFNITDLANNLIDHMLDLLNNPEDEHEAIHITRKSIKKMRALLRLIRNEIGETHYQIENEAYRDLGRQLSGIRDATALLETIEKLKKKAPDQLQSELQVINELLLHKRDILINQHIRQGNSFVRIVTDIKLFKLRMASWPLNNEQFDIWAKGLQSTYKKGNKLCIIATNSIDPHDFHQWRKQVKYLWNQLLFLVNIWPPLLEVFTKQLSVLSSLLGDEHDLAVLKTSIFNGYINHTLSIEIDAFIDNEIALLREKALRLGHLIYAEKPRDFFARNSHYWTIMRGNL